MFDVFRVMRTVACIGVVLVAATQYSYTQTQLARQVVGSGGTIGASASSQLLSATVGQTIIGMVSNNSNKLSQGFWLPLENPTSVDEDPGPISEGEVSNYPNPFSSFTTISMRTPATGAVSVRVYDVVGNLLRELRMETSETGSQEIVWDGRDETGMPVATGAYLYEVRGTSATDGKPFVRVNRMNVVR